MRLTFLAVAATPGLRRGVFPKDEPLDARGHEATRACAPHLPRAEVYWTSPAACATQSAAALGLAATPVEALRECDYGAWAGAELRDIAARYPADYSAWLRDPAVAPHGGESVADLIERAGAWLARLAIAPSAPDVLAITHVSVVRAAVVHARALPAASYGELAVTPLTLTALRREPAGWIVRFVSATPGSELDP